MSSERGREKESARKTRGRERRACRGEERAPFHPRLYHNAHVQLRSLCEISTCTLAGMRSSLPPNDERRDRGGVRIEAEKENEGGGGGAGVKKIRVVKTYLLLIREKTH